jgi:hypothetical protein
VKRFSIPSLMLAVLAAALTLAPLHSVAGAASVFASPHARVISSATPQAHAALAAADIVRPSWAPASVKPRVLGAITVDSTAPAFVQSSRRVRHRVFRHYSAPGQSPVFSGRSPPHCATRA